MGWLSDVWEGVKSAGRAVVNKAREKAGEVIGWMAEKGERFVGSVKKVWGVVRPHLDKVQAALKAAAAATAVSMPWLSGALLALDKGITVLTAFENSPIAKKVDQAIQFAINLAKSGRPVKSSSLMAKNLNQRKSIKRHSGRQNVNLPLIQNAISWS